VRRIPRYFCISALQLRYVLKEQDAHVYITCFLYVFLFFFCIFVVFAMLRCNLSGVLGHHCRLYTHGGLNSHNEAMMVNLLKFVAV
jgi:hypothetical protein